MAKGFYMKTSVITREIFGNFLGNGYGADCSQSTFDTRNSLLNMPVDNAVGRSFFKTQNSESNIRYTALLFAPNKKQNFFATNGRTGAYLGISLSVNNNAIDANARQIMWDIMDRLCGTIYTKLPNQDLKLLTNDTYGFALQKYDDAINTVIGKFNNAEPKAEQTKSNIFDSIFKKTDYEYLNNLNFFKLKNPNDKQMVTDLLKSGGISVYKILYNDTFVINDDVYKQYIKQTRKNTKDFYFLTKTK